MRALSLSMIATGCVTALHVAAPSSLEVGAAAPAFRLSDERGHAVALPPGPTVLVFYRGFW